MSRGSKSATTGLIANEVAGAAELAAAGKQKAALVCLKKKRVLEKELETLASSKLNLFQSEHTLHALKFNSLIVDAQNLGMQAIEREIKKVHGVDGVEKVQDKLEDLLADAGDVLQAGNRTMGELASVDDDELLEEVLWRHRMHKPVSVWLRLLLTPRAGMSSCSQLEQMELTDLTQQLCQTNSGANNAEAGSSSSTTSNVTFAQVPQNDPVASARARKKAMEKEEERELMAELQASMMSMKMETPMHMPMMAACF